MKTKNLFSIVILSLIVMMTTGFVLKPKEIISKHFEIGLKDKPISAQKKNVLLKAYKAQFGGKSNIDRIEFVGTDDLWLVFQSGGEGTNTFAIQTENKNGKVVIGQNSVTNTCSGNPCSWCYFDSNNGCICNKDSAGKCNHTQTSLMEFGTFASNLGL
jgi:hypothetical protein